MESTAARLGLLIAGLCMAHAAQAQVYRCVSPAGKVEYADAPCEKGARATVVDVRPNVIESTGLREQALRLENERLKEQIRNPAGAPTITASAPAAAQSGESATRVDPIACKQARRDYEVTASSTSNTKELIRAKESAMYSECGLKEPDRQNIEVNVQREAPPRYLIIHPPASVPRRSP